MKIEDRINKAIKDLESGSTENVILCELVFVHGFDLDKANSIISWARKTLNPLYKKPDADV